MSAKTSDLDALSDELWQKGGVAGFVPTTLSADMGVLQRAVTAIGGWIRRGKAPGAVPLGIHLEGPFISDQAAGAHPPRSLRRLKLSELEALWNASHGTLKILTVAPELLSLSDLKRLGAFARARRIRLSLGHSRATEAQSKLAFDHGFSGITHCWNAHSFHHREAGPLGAGLGRKGVYPELIIDQQHVSLTVIDWTRKLHPDGLCFVSDATPAAGARGRTVSFGPDLKVRERNGASRLARGALAGGSLLLPEAFAKWLRSEHLRSGASLPDLFRRALPALARDPLRAIGLTTRSLQGKRLRWDVDWRGQPTFQRIR